ncbi:MAG TPA: hypothetical protein VH107_20725, partial [Lacipirellulaceae bacterium]|nr:hypothetical protein [Lacipirellulaceae bacterium]
MPALATSDIKAAGATSRFMPVQIQLLRRLTRTPADLCLLTKGDAEPILYHRAGFTLDSGQIDRLADSGVQQIYVRTDQFQDFAACLLETIDASPDPVPSGERYAALQLAMAVEIEHAARLMDCGPYVAVAEKLGRELTTLLIGNNVLPKDLYCLARHDFNTFSHVTNVASYGVILGEQLGLCDTSRYEELARAAILHDIG